MAVLSLPQDIGSHTLQYAVVTPLAKGTLQLTLRHHQNTIEVRGSATLKALGGFIVPLEVETQAVWTKGESPQLSQYNRKLRLMGKDQDVTSMEIPSGTIDYASTLFALQSALPSLKEESVHTLFFDGKKTSEAYLSLAKNNQKTIPVEGSRELLFSKLSQASEENRLWREVEVWVDERSGQVTKIGYVLPALGEIKISLIT
ncbi:MAG: hypothetical protein AB7F59_01065 [Bdellovibrionales bacterium]